ncbi:MAG: dienelactone hydrolase family protein [Verrucomicrobia bacterium]|nr:dienelactone hydrolase family protein [Verrucomicrobiota bacterium]
MITHTKRVQKTGSWWVGVPLMLGAALCGLTSASHAEEWAADKPFTYPNPSDMLQRHNTILEAVKKTPDANIIFIGDKPNTTGTPGTQSAAPGHLRHFDAKTVEQAQAWQRESVTLMAVDKKMTALLGQRKAAGPEQDYGTPLKAKIISQADKGKFTRIEVEFDVFDNWRTRAIVTVPKEGGPFPAVVFIEGKPERPYESPTACGTVLAEAGYITLSLDVQGDRTHKPELGGHERLVPGIRAVDYLLTRPDVDREKIGVAGLCRWGALAVFDAHLDPRIKAVVAAACLFKAAPGGRYYATINNDPHDFRDCYAMLAPRPLLVQLGKADAYLPMFPSEQDLADARKAYEVLGHPELFEIFWHPGGHLIEGSSLPPFFKKAFSK